MITEAAGGVLWRSGPTGAPEVAVIHRPKYDDWTLPKGKLDPGEHRVVAAVRELREETGSTTVPGRPLGTTTYTKDGAPKRVHYWAMRHLAGDFSPNAEVDRLVWASVAQAVDRLDPERDRRIVETFAADPRPTRPVVVVRHASAGDRDTWRGPDLERPLDEFGRRQARALVPLLRAYGVSRVVTSPALRCRDTVAPFVASDGAPLVVEDLFSEQGYGDAPEDAARTVRLLAESPETTAVCSQRVALPGLLTALADGADTGIVDGDDLPKAGLVVVHRSQPDGAVVAVEHLPAPYA